VNNNNYENFLDNNYFFIGLTEQLEDSLQKLSGILKKKINKDLVPRLKVTGRDKQYESLSGTEINAFRQANILDYNLYNYCTNRFGTDTGNNF
jgi:hypothetical protein